MTVTDIEVIPQNIGDNPLIQFKLKDVSAPSNWKDPDKIAAYEAEARAKELSKLGLDPKTGTILFTGMLLIDNEEADFDSISHPFDTMEYEIYKELGSEEKVKAKVVFAGLKTTNAIEPDSPPVTSIDEIGGLNTAWQLMEEDFDNGGKVITYNGKAFDLPYMIKRSIINRINPPNHLPDFKSLTNKYSYREHLDLFNFFENGGLVEWSYLIGNADSLERDGNKIYDWYLNGEIERIKMKNVVDLFQTYYLYKEVIKWVKY